MGREERRGEGLLRSRWHRVRQEGSRGPREPGIRLPGVARTVGKQMQAQDVRGHSRLYCPLHMRPAACCPVSINPRKTMPVKSAGAVDALGQESRSDKTWF